MEKVEARERKTLFQMITSSILNIFVLIIAIVFILELVLGLFAKFFGVDTSITFLDTFKNVALIPDLFRSNIAYYTCCIVLKSFIVPLAFLIMIIRNFKNNYLIPKDLKIYKIFVVICIIISSVSTCYIVYNKQDEIITNYQESYELIDAANIDDRGYYEEGCDDMKFLLPLTIILFSITGIITIIISLILLNKKNIIPRNENL